MVLDDRFNTHFYLLPKTQTKGSTDNYSPLIFCFRYVEREQIQILSAHKSVSEAAFETFATRELKIRERRAPEPSGTIYESNEIERVMKAVPLIDFVSAFVDLGPVAMGQ